MDKMVTKPIGMIENLRFFEGKKVLITGHTGFKGSWLCFILNSVGADLYGYSLKPNSNQRLFEYLKLENKVKSEFGNISDFNKLEKFISKSEPDVVIHMAAQPLVRYSYENPVETYATNVMGTVNLLESCKSVSSIKAILNITTDKVYENKEWIWGYREDERLGGFDPYSSSKACSEMVTSAYMKSYYNYESESKPAAIIATARAGNVIGGGDWSEDRLIPDIINSFITEQKVLIRNPLSTRPWQHVFEPLCGYLELIRNMCIFGSQFEGNWNFGPNDNDAKTVEFIFRRMSELWGIKSEFITESTTQPHEARFLKLDCSKAKTLLKWQPKWNIDRALKEIIIWHKAHLNNENLEEVSLRMLNRYLNNK